MNESETPQMLKLQQLKYAELGRRTVAFDFDDTITIRAEGGAYNDIIGFNQPVIDLMRKYHEAGLHVMILTGRCCERWGDCIEDAAAKVAKILRKNNIPYSEIWTGRGKPFCAAYLGDECNFDPADAEESCRKFDALVKKRMKGICFKGLQNPEKKAS